MKFTINHHFSGVQMGRLCVEKATREDLRTLCDQIVEAQEAEIRQLQSWLAEWYGITDFTPRLTPEDQQMLEHLASLSGTEFDMEISREFTRHHVQIIVRAAGCLERAFHEDLLDFCEDTVVMQGEEAREFRRILCDLGVCDPRRNSGEADHGDDR